MKKWLLAFLLVPILSNYAIAEDKAREEANMLLLKASELEKFQRQELPKFHLEVHFTFHSVGGQDLQGTYSRYLSSSNLWRDELAFGDFRWLHLRKDRTNWISKNSDFLPMQATESWKALYTVSFRMTANDGVKRVHDRILNKVDHRCIEFENVYGKVTKEGEICVQKDSGLVTTWTYDGREITYWDYSPFVGGLRPRHIKIEFPSHDAILADVSWTEVPAFDDAKFAPIPGAAESAVCSSSRAPIVRHAPDPMRPPNVSGRYKGNVIVDVEVGPDGLVLKTAIVESVQSDLDAAAAEAVRKWEFEPGTCDGKAVESITQVTVIYK